MMGTATRASVAASDAASDATSDSPDDRGDGLGDDRDDDRDAGMVLRRSPVVAVAAAAAVAHSDSARAEAPVGTQRGTCQGTPPATGPDWPPHTLRAFFEPSATLPAQPAPAPPITPLPPAQAASFIRRPSSTTEQNRRKGRPPRTVQPPSSPDCRTKLRVPIAASCELQRASRRGRRRGAVPRPPSRRVVAETSPSPPPSPCASVPRRVKGGMADPPHPHPGFRWWRSGRIRCRHGVLVLMGDGDLPARGGYSKHVELE
ncbi:hypothetical protein EIP86_009659 [Pleurotus ostreatoroseus]|nr:hypothetical protein EIP86_009659 [Pleurotus ostreatoroseus]